MSPASRVSLLEDVLRILQQDFSRPHYLAQLAVIALSLIGAWLATRWVKRSIDARLHAESTAPRHHVDLLRFSIAGARRLAFPVAALALLIAGGLMLLGAGLVRGTGDVQLLRLAATLLGAMALIRLFVYVLRRTFARSAWLGTFERAIALMIWLLVALHVTGLQNDLVGLFEAIRIPIGKAQISLLDLAAATVSVVLTLLAALWAGSAIEANLMSATKLAPNSRVVLSRLLKALLILVAVLVALALVGIDLTVVSVFGGALGVGLGLGLQRIASNYVSGFIILLDRSLTLGDMITVDKYNGRVTQINTRYTVVKALDGTETFVPNEMLVNTPVINHSYSDRRLRIVLKVSVGYQADVDAALTILTEAARAQARVMADPAPAAFISGFGAGGVELEAGFTILDSGDGTLPVRSAVAREVLRQFASAGIEIPSPQRDIRLTHAIGPSASP